MLNHPLEAADFRFEIRAIDEPEMGCTHIVILRELDAAGNDTGVVLDRFTTDDPYGAVEAAREAQEYTLEERFDIYAQRGW